MHARPETAGARGPSSPTAPRPADPGRERFRRWLVAVERLPALPDIAAGSLALLDRDDCKLADLAAYLAADQAITAGLLRLANSAFYAPVRITDLTHAVTRLGFARVRDLVVGLSVWNSFGSDATRRNALWIHSALVAGAAKTLAQRTGRDDGEAFTGAVVHDVGKLLLGLRVGDPYWALMDASEGRESDLVAAELREFGCHHGTVGGSLFEVWRLPPALVEVVRHHHDPLLPGQRLDSRTIVRIADRLVEATDPATGTLEEEAFREVERVAPGLVNRERWPATWARIAREQQVISAIFL